MSNVKHVERKKVMSVDVVAIRDAYTALVEQFDTVLLGTVSNNGLPDASYAPYVYVDGYYYVYVSELATHTGNLLNTDKV
ncbi:MAG: pyridoxamine 5'-phosphate oxidase family protein, partial [Gammaproteobacteria bacterium]|nr:pyridoxamine 5'-phosphate oxidase family protein [Gammaproteobacteria bacterium]